MNTWHALTELGFSGNTLNGGGTLGISSLGNNFGNVGSKGRIGNSGTGNNNGNGHKRAS
jgi:hypothetical protein